MRYDISSPDKKILLFTGNYGSGKSEVAVNYTLFLHALHGNTTIVDLDIINPYFRCREASEMLEHKGINVVMPEGELKYADLPIIVPEIKGIISAPKGYTILDVGGEDTGARVLSYFNETFVSKNIPHEFFLVINRNRPFTSDFNGVKNMVGLIERSSKLKVTGLVSNTHILDDTDIDSILYGYELSKESSEKLNLPLIFVTIPDKLLKDAPKDFAAPLLPIRRILNPAWKN